ncbi:hypothetical protein NL676_013673 [Syzygium grande]|nr:hypothetical protein NL676_013673 [Syzygium grande]
MEASILHGRESGPPYIGRREGSTSDKLSERGASFVAKWRRQVSALWLGGRTDSLWRMGSRSMRPGKKKKRA